jgi:dihydrofolate reductase
VVAPSLAAALAVARGDALRRGVDEIVVLGGADIYAQTLALADRLVLTRVRLRPAGDTLFPTIDPALWHEVERTDHVAGPNDEAGFSICVYERLTRPQAAAGSL